MSRTHTPQPVSTKLDQDSINNQATISATATLGAIENNLVAKEPRTLGEWIDAADRSITLKWVDNKAP